MNNIMLDLETMGTESNAAIIAIGAVRFNEISIAQDRFYRVIDLESSMGAGLVTDASTIMWWMKQDDAARKEFFNGGVSLPQALIDFSHWLCPDPIIWGNGATADNVWLSNAYKACDIEKPWKYWADRCYRTIAARYPDIPKERIGTYHKAVDDAETQALHLIKCWQHDADR